MIELTIINSDQKMLFNIQYIISVQAYIQADIEDGSIVTMRGGKAGTDFRNYYVKETYSDVKKLFK